MFRGEITNSGAGDRPVKINKTQDPEQFQNKCTH